MKFYLKKHVVFKFKKAFLAFGTKKESETLFYEFLIAVKKHIKKSPFCCFANSVRECETSF